MKNFDELLKKYADFIVRVGVNPQPGQVLIINCALEGAPLARLCVRSAFEAGARDVQVNWTDDAVTRTRMELGSEEALTDHKGWQLRRYLDYAETEGGVCVLHLIADDPEVFAGLDGAKISRVNSANRAFMQPWREYTMNDRVQWSIAAIPSAPWAKKMFPELDTDAAIEALWQLIFDTCRVTGGDPVGEWQEHLARLSALRDKMNALDLESVHFASGNGTDLTVGIADQAVWESAASKNEKGVTFLPNIPTEEVFTAPHKDKVNGVVYGTKPYAFNGQLIKGFHVTFKDGKVVEHGAEEGADLLGQLIRSIGGNVALQGPVVLQNLNNIRHLQRLRLFGADKVLRLVERGNAEADQQGADGGNDQGDIAGGGQKCLVVGAAALGQQHNIQNHGHSHGNHVVEYRGPDADGGTLARIIRHDGGNGLRSHVGDGVADDVNNVQQGKHRQPQPFGREAGEHSVKGERLNQIARNQQNA